MYKTFKDRTPPNDWMTINFSVINTPRQTMFAVNQNNRLKVGNNVLANRFWFVNGKVNLEWLNLSFSLYKVKCKELFL